MSSRPNWRQAAAEPTRTRKKQVVKGVPMVNREVTVCIIDARHMPSTTRLHGVMPVPVMLLTPGQRVNWPVPGIYCRQKNNPEALILKCPGAVTDVSPQVVFVFPFMSKYDAYDAKGQVLTTQDIVNLFKAYVPELKEIGG